MLDNLFRGISCGFLIAFWLVLMIGCGIFIAHAGYINNAEYGKIGLVLLLVVFYTFKIIDMLGDAWFAKA